jgi:DNA-binding PadR family transcriptional regulator
MYAARYMRARTPTSKPKETTTARAMTSAVHWALLGLVIKRPGYGYDLIKRFERDYKDALVLKSNSHIYTGLNELENRGLIEEVPGSGPSRSNGGRQPKPSYRATAKGLHAYREWLKAQVREDRRQSRLFVRQLAALEHEPDEALKIIDCYEQACLTDADSAPVARAQDSPVDDAPGLAARLVSEESRLAMQARLPWVEYARGEFRALSAGARGK